MLDKKKKVSEESLKKERLRLAQQYLVQSDVSARSFFAQIRMLF